MSTYDRWLDGKTAVTAIEVLKQSLTKVSSGSILGTIPWG